MSNVAIFGFRKENEEEQTGSSRIYGVQNMFKHMHDERGHP